MIYDSIIIGAGPAGLTAGIYLGRYQRETLLLTEDIGGQTAIAGALENFPGYLEINGAKLIGEMQKKIEDLDKVNLKIGQPVVKVTGQKGEFEVTTKTESFKSKTVLIAAGKRHRELNVDNEREMVGKGISYCATCDGTFARGKDVVVIGDGNAAEESALIVAKLAKSVSIIALGNRLNGEKINTQKIINNPKIKIIYNTKTEKILTKDGFVSGISTSDNKSGEKKEINCQMIFVEIGQIPNSEKFAKFVSLNDHNEIKVDSKNHTSTEGAFAAGDITDVSAKQVVVACGEGAKAAIEINRYLDATEETNVDKS